MIHKLIIYNLLQKLEEAKQQPARTWAEKASQRAIERSLDFQIRTEYHEWESALLEKEYLAGTLSHEEFWNRKTELIKEQAAISEEYARRSLPLPHQSTG